MCGIAVSYDHQAASPSPRQAAVERMMSRMRHRGPDGSGTVVHGPTVLGQTRLAIMDVAGGRQPIVDAAGAQAVVGNGELYNQAELRRRYSDRHSFRTTSDTEVVLPAYAQLGPAAAPLLDGMFSLAIATADDLCVMRDPLGIKPLYYGRAGSGLLFASEIRALDGEVTRIRPFPPGHCYRPDRGFERYYSPPARTGIVRDPVEAKRIVRTALEEAVHSHLMADVPVGAFLSGGLDSSLLAMLAAREISELHTFAVGLEGSPDLAAAEEVARFLGSRHHACVLTPEAIEASLPAVVRALESYDAALVRSAIPTWHVARLAAQTRTSAGERIKVVLTGEGADEVFAGYEYLAPLRGRALEDELTRLLSNLHHLNLQRVDRMTMAHGLEARVPFLATSFVARTMRIDPQLKEAATFGHAKGLLRSAFEGRLPPSILWRKKAEFAQGSSVSGVLAALVDSCVSDHEWNEARRTGLPIRNREELVYHRILQASLQTPLGPDLIGRWQGPLL